jgi:RNA polymerase sigma factor (sigma-70 family)
MNQDDFELLRQFVRSGDQRAFETLVRRHVDLVFATAARKLQDKGAAEEVAQNVFAALARKAWLFARGVSLPSWLYKTTLLEAKAYLRADLRRRRRERIAIETEATMKISDEQSSRVLLPLLDEALLSLREKDRTALLLRYYESRSLRDVGVSLGVSEDAAQKRVASALQQVVQFFHRRGFRSATLATTGAALQHTARSAPTAVTTTVIKGCLPFAPPALAGFAAAVHV